MGQSKQKRARFIDEHPICCFCGGDTPATTIDHVPARVCFPGRAAPEGFEFPACSKCQNASRLDELVFGFYVRMMDRNEANFDPIGTDRLITGLANNAPHLLPNPYHSGRIKRGWLRDQGLRKPPNMLADDIPMADFDPEVNSFILRYARKIACALFYREQKTIAGREYRVFTFWEQSSLPRAQKTLDGFINMTPTPVRGWRPNLDFGDRFGYRYNNAATPDIMAALGLFGQGLVIATMIVEPEFWQKLKWQEGWSTVATMFDE